MNESASSMAIAIAAERLPMWWRYMLIAAATLILCSCSSPATRTNLTADKTLLDESRANESAPGMLSANTSPHSGAQEYVVHDQPSAEPGAVGGVACPTCNGGPCNDAMCNGGACGGAPMALDPYGPLPGPADEYLCDGGDFETPAGVTKNGEIKGLEPEDAIGHYTAADGHVYVTPSNRVCVYAPRFAAVRRVVDVVSHEQPVFVNAALEAEGPAKAAKTLPPIQAKQRHAVSVDLGQRPPSLFRQRQQAGGLENLQAAMDAYTSLGPYADLQLIRTGEVSAAEKPRLERAMESAKTLVGDQAPQVAFGVKMAEAEVGIKQPGLIYQTNGPNHPRLRLCKLASCGNALPGEEIEFTLRFDNVGDQVIDRVTIADNLAARFEYIPGSAKTSLDAQLTDQPNDNGSSVLIWEMKDPLKPGAGGILRFKVRVR